MKKALLFSAALAVMALVSCNTEIGADVPQPGDPVEVNVLIKGAPGTRVTGLTNQDGRNDAASEAKVDSLQVFVFNGNDREAYRKVKNALSVLVPATSGERSVWAIVNAPDLDGVMSLIDLQAALTSLADNKTDSFVMTGSVSQELTDGGQVPITVKRIVSRVSINKISTDLKDYRASYSVNVRAIYLINVAGNNNYGLNGTPSLWVNKLGHEDTAFDSMLYDELTAVVVKNSVYAADGSIETDNSYRNEHVFYPYPNVFGTDAEGYTPDYSDTWTPRGTILVVEATMLDGNGEPIVISDATGQTIGYYPVVLPRLERNKTYIIEELCITRLPGTHPYKPIETGETQVTISVADWDLGLNLGTVRI
jgi:hypothetical protein